MDITKLTEVELKAMKSDAYEAISLNRANIDFINAELNRRKETKVEETKEVKEGN